MTPSGGWNPACIAGNTGIGMSQRMQAFVLDPAKNPFNVVRPGQRPRATLSPSLALKDGRPFLSWSIQGGDEQDQRCLQHFLNVVEWGATVQQACEAPDITSGQMQSTFGSHVATPGDLRVDARTPQDIIKALTRMGYRVRTAPAQLGSHECDLLRLEARQFLGRFKQQRRGLRHRLETITAHYKPRNTRKANQILNFRVFRGSCFIGGRTGLGGRTRRG